jgi:uncharacterized protein (DUF433 family)
MSSSYVSGRVPARYERLVTKQARAARTSKSDLVARYVIEESLETEYPGISFRDSLSGRETYLTGHRVAVREVLAVHEETKSVEKTASHFRWPRVLVNRALAYAKAFPEEIHIAREEEAGTSLGCSLTRIRRIDSSRPARVCAGIFPLFTSHGGKTDPGSAWTMRPC